MWNGKNKAVSFSYDDGVVQDIRLVEIFNRYGLKCTFNLNSALMGEQGSWTADNGKRVERMTPERLPELYKGHEIAVHCAKHANLQELDDEAVRREILDDKAALEKLFGYSIIGMAYPYGAYDERIIRLVGECGIKHCRTVRAAYDFAVQDNLLEFAATCHHSDERLWELLDEFLNYEGSEPAQFIVWGHSYEFYLNDNWELIERFCREISGKDDVFYGTVSEVLMGK